MFRKRPVQYRVSSLMSVLSMPGVALPSASVRSSSSRFDRRHTQDEVHIGKLRTEQVVRKSQGSPMSDRGL
jgi:hypothetical protein